MIKDMLKALDDPPTLYPCTAKFVNDTPREWNVHVIAVGAVFYYDDGTTAQVGPVAVKLTGGGGNVSLSSPTQKCTIRVTGGMTAKRGNDADKSFAKDNQAEADQCMLVTNFILAPNKSVTKEQFAKRLGPDESFELT